MMNLDHIRKYYSYEIDNWNLSLNILKELKKIRVVMVINKHAFPVFNRIVKKKK